MAIDWNQVIFKGLEIKGIYGREMFETWYKMVAMLQSGLDLTPIITHHYAVDAFEAGVRDHAFRRERQGRSSTGLRSRRVRLEALGGASSTPVVDSMSASFEAVSLWGLLASGFLSATLLPGNSELVFAALVHHAPALKWPALAIATLGNTLAGSRLTSSGGCFPSRSKGAGDWHSRGQMPDRFQGVRSFDDADVLAPGQRRGEDVTCRGKLERPHEHRH